MRETVDSFASQAEAAGVLTDAQVQSGLPLADADPVRAREILENLIANALRNTPRGEILLADGLFRGVALPAGSHRVVFRYRPVSAIAGGAISAVALVVLLLLARQGEPRRAGAVLAASPLLKRKF